MGSNYAFLWGFRRVINCMRPHWRPEEVKEWMWLISVFHCLLLSTSSTARCLEWSLAWWAAPLGYTLHLSPPGGQTCRQLTAVTPAHLCIRPATPPRVTCTRPSSLAGTPSTNTRSIFPASPTSMGKPPRAGLNSLCTLLTLLACQSSECKDSEHFQSSTFKKKRRRRGRSWGDEGTAVIGITVWMYWWLDSWHPVLWWQCHLCRGLKRHVE